MHSSVIRSLETVNSTEWNDLAGDNPFLHYEFLIALERSGCVGSDTGWQPHYLLLHADNSLTGRLLGAVPLYLKYHSYGEYVFDWSWADAYTRTGRSYYPKLTAAVPFTPATGKRMLLRADIDDKKIRHGLIAAAHQLTEEIGASSLHWLFTTQDEAEALSNFDFIVRTGCQFHWSNPDYRDFEDFLSVLTAHKRNNIRRERRRVREAGITIEIVEGIDATPELWDVFYRFYRSTIRVHGAIAYLNREFFQLLGETMKQNVILTVAKKNRAVVGIALALRNDHSLYGRYWGGQPGIAGLHFETCYYAPIEYCIARRIQRYEAGAQGEHKLARGFVPTTTYSAHWLRDPALQRAVGDFLRRERNQVDLYIDELNEHTPFRKESTR